MCGLWGGMERWGPLISLKKKREQSQGLGLVSCTECTCVLPVVLLPFWKEEQQYCHHGDISYCHHGDIADIAENNLT